MWRMSEGPFSILPFKKVYLWEQQILSLGSIVLSSLRVTLIFTLTILLRINFTSGYLTSFILFAQILDTLSIEANGGVVLNGSMETLAALTQIVYSPFNLDLFRVEKLSFCFGPGFNFLEVSTIRFLTLTYCLILVLILVIILRVNLCYKV